jgi:hypothetical protein
MPTLFAVLWSPQISFRKLDHVQVRMLLAYFIAIEFVLTLAILPYFVEAGVKMTAANPLVTDGTRLFATGLALTMVALFDTMLIGAAALLFLLLVRVLGGSAQYRELAGMLVLAMVPLVLSRALRNIAFLLGYLPDPNHSPLALARFAPAWLIDLTHGALGFIDVFDVWAFALVVAGFVSVAGLKRVPASLAGIAVWGLLQLVLIRMQLGGAA